ncbi:unnamed protein product [Ectocarpus sp. 12 AP-2014]
MKTNSWLLLLVLLGALLLGSANGSNNNNNDINNDINNGINNLNDDDRNSSTNDMVPPGTKEESAIGTAAATAPTTAAIVADADAYGTTDAPMSATIPVVADLTEGMSGADLGLTTAITTSTTTATATTTDEGITDPRDSLADSPAPLTAPAPAADPAIVPTGPLVPGTAPNSTEAKNTTTLSRSDPTASAIDNNVADPFNGSDDTASKEESSSAAAAAADTVAATDTAAADAATKVTTPTIFPSKTIGDMGNHQSTDGSNSNANGYHGRPSHADSCDGDGGGADAAGTDAAPELPEEPTVVPSPLEQDAACTATATATNKGARNTADTTPVVKSKLRLVRKAMPDKDFSVHLVEGSGLDQPSLRLFKVGADANDPAKAKKVILLVGDTSVEPTSHNGSTDRFVVQTPKGVWSFRASDTKNRDAWVNAIRSVRRVRSNAGHGTDGVGKRGGNDGDDTDGSTDHGSDNGGDDGSDGPAESASGDATPDAVQLQLRKEGKVLHKTTFRGWQPRDLSLVSGSVLRLCHTKHGVFKQQPTCKACEQPLDRSSEVVALSEQDVRKADDGRFMFRVVTKPLRGKMHTKWTLDAESQSELDAWVSLVQEAIALADPGVEDGKHDDSKVQLSTGSRPGVDVPLFPPFYACGFGPPPFTVLNYGTEDTAVSKAKQAPRAPEQGAVPTAPTTADAGTGMTCNGENWKPVLQGVRPFGVSNTKRRDAWVAGTRRVLRVGSTDDDDTDDNDGGGTSYGCEDDSDENDDNDNTENITAGGYDGGDGPEDSASDETTPDGATFRKEGKVLFKTMVRGWQPGDLSLVADSVLRLCHTKRGFGKHSSCKARPLDRSSEVVRLSEQDVGKVGNGRFMFRVVSGNPRGRTNTKWTLDAESQSELDEWVSILTEAIIAQGPAGNEETNRFDGARLAQNLGDSSFTSSNLGPDTPDASRAFRGQSMSPGDYPLQTGQFLSTAPLVESTNVEITEIGDIILRAGDIPAFSGDKPPLWAYRATGSTGDKADGGMGCVLESWWRRIVKGTDDDIPVHLYVKNGRWRVGRGRLCTMGQSPKPHGSWRANLPWDAQGRAIKTAALELRDSAMVLVTPQGEILWSSAPLP